MGLNSWSLPSRSHQVNLSAELKLFFDLRPLSLPSQPCKWLTHCWWLCHNVVLSLLSSFLWQNESIFNAGWNCRQTSKHFGFCFVFRFCETLVFCKNETLRISLVSLFPFIWQEIHIEMIIMQGWPASLAAYTRNTTEQWNRMTAAQAQWPWQGTVHIQIPASVHCFLILTRTACRGLIEVITNFYLLLPFEILKLTEKKIYSN